MDNGYESSGTIGGKLGCLAATLLGLPLWGVLLFLSFYGHCGPSDPCRDGQGARVLFVFGVAAAVAAVVGFMVRLIVNNRLDREGE
jgi:hypothetical protein